jgi:hypothetical protein
MSDEALSPAIHVYETCLEIIQQLQVIIIVYSTFKLENKALKQKSSQKVIQNIDKTILLVQEHLEHKREFQEVQLLSYFRLN